MYKKTQFGWIGFWIIMIIVVFNVILFLLFLSADARSSIVPATVPLLLILLLVKDLTVSVDDEFIRLTYGIGLIKIKFDITEVRSCKKIENAFVLGWGIRWNRDFILYNISGRDSVELTFKDGRKKVRIGTADLDGLYDAINSRIR